MLTKRSTHVDQNFTSSKGMSQLSVAIFIAPRTHLRAQKSLFLSKKSEKRTNINIPYVDSAQRCSLIERANARNPEKVSVFPKYGPCKVRFEMKTNDATYISDEFQVTKY